MEKKKILVIDDEADYVEILSARLMASGYDAVSATDGSEGLKIAEKERPDLILLDVRMPNMDGHTMMKHLKKFGSRHRNIPVIIVTGVSELKDVFELEGANDFIKKPFEHKELLAKIEKALGEGA